MNNLKRVQIDEKISYLSVLPSSKFWKFCDKIGHLTIHNKNEVRNGILDVISVPANELILGSEKVFEQLLLSNFKMHESLSSSITKIHVNQGSFDPKSINRLKKLCQIIPDTFTSLKEDQKMALNLRYGSYRMASIKFFKQLFDLEEFVDIHEVRIGKDDLFQPQIILNDCKFSLIEKDEILFIDAKKVMIQFPSESIKHVKSLKCNIIDPNLQSA